MLQRIFLILAILAGVGVIVVSRTKLREHIQSIITQREKNAQDRDSEKSRANKAEKALGIATNDLVRVNGELAATRQQLETTKSNLETANSARDKAQQDLEKAKDSERTCQQDLEKWRALGMTPEGVKEAVANLAKAKEAVAVMTEENKVLNHRIVVLSNQLADILNPNEDWAPEMPGLKGKACKVLVVDPKWEFVVLDVGENQGALMKGVLLIHRDSKLIAKVRIMSLMPDRCIANVVRGWKVEDVLEGDQALY